MSLLVSLLGLAAWSIWGYTVIIIDPAVPLAPLAFYGSLFVALTCTLAKLREAPAYEERGGTLIPARPSLGHGASATIVLLFALWLQSLRMMTPLNLILLGFALFFVELGFALTGRQHRSARARRPRRAQTAPAARLTEQ